MPVPLQRWLCARELGVKWKRKIIKARIETEAPAAVGARILKKDVYEAGLDARELLEGARKQAQAILARRRAAPRRDRPSRPPGGVIAQGIAEWDRRASQAARKPRRRWTPPTRRKWSGWQ